MQTQYQTPEQILSDEFEKKRLSLLKALEQGEKMSNLQMAPEWEFFVGWLEATKTELAGRVLGESFIRDHNGYLFTTGAYQAIDRILLGIKGFEKAYKKASRQMLQLQKERDLTE